MAMRDDFIESLYQDLDGWDARLCAPQDEKSLWGDAPPEVAKGACGLIRGSIDGWALPDRTVLILQRSQADLVPDGQVTQRALFLRIQLSEHHDMNEVLHRLAHAREVVIEQGGFPMLPAAFPGCPLAAEHVRLAYWTADHGEPVVLWQILVTEAV